MIGALTDKSGSGLALFQTSPTIITPTIASFANANHNHQNSAGGGTLTLASIVTPGTVLTNGASFAAGVSNDFSVDFTHQFKGNAAGLTLSALT